MCRFTYTQYSCGHQSPLEADMAECPRIAVEEAAGRKGPFSPCPPPPPDHGTVMWEGTPMRCSVCHQAFMKEEEDKLLREFEFFREVAKDSQQVMDRLQVWYECVCSEIEELVPEWIEGTKNGTRDIYHEYPRWLVFRLNRIYEWYELLNFGRQKEWLRR